MSVKLIRLSVSLNANGWKASRMELEADEKPKSYKILNDQQGFWSRRQLSKDELGRPGSAIRRLHDDYHAFVYCKPEDEAAMAKLLVDTIREQHRAIREELDAVTFRIVSPVEFVTKTPRD